MIGLKPTDVSAYKPSLIIPLQQNKRSRTSRGHP